MLDLLLPPLTVLVIALASAVAFSTEHAGRGSVVGVLLAANAVLAAVSLWRMWRDGTLAQLSDIGFRNVEAFGFVSRADELAAAFARHGIAAPTGHASLASGTENPFDASIASALADGDAAALVALDPELGAALGSTGVPTLRTLGTMVLDATKGASVTAHLRYDGAPLGVGYVVADWLLTA